MSKHSEDFLVELGCAELPPKALKTLSDAFQSGVEAGLGKAGLSYAKIQSFASPRRLAILITRLDVQQDLLSAYKKELASVKALAVVL